METINIHVATRSPLYGGKYCQHCRLTVAEYLNGQSYHLSSGHSIYLHHGCRSPTQQVYSDQNTSNHDHEK